MKHTPGPWYAANMGNDYQGLVIDEKTGANIAVTYDKRHAPFVAAAPAMYAESKTLCSLVRAFMNDNRLYDGQLIQAIHNLETALAQAEGKG